MALADAPYERVGDGVLLHPGLQGLRRLALFTRDSATLYARRGFVAPPGLPSYMEIVDRDVYRAAATKPR